MKESIALVTVLVYGVIGIYYWQFYRVFEVDIFQFMELQEILINGLPVLTFSLLAAVTTTAYVQTGPVYMKHIFSKPDDRNCISYVKKISLTVFSHFFLFSLLSVLLMSVNLGYYYLTSIIILFQAVFYVIICINLVRHFESVKQVRKVHGLTLSFLCFHLLVFSFGTAGVNAAIIKKSQNNRIYSFTYNGTDFDFTSSMSLFGMTNNYMFIYDKSKSSSIILSRAKIDSISVRLKKE